jgi:hypothetical protein
LTLVAGSDNPSGGDLREFARLLFKYEIPFQRGRTFQGDCRMRAVVTGVLIMVSLVLASRIASGQTMLTVEGLRSEYLSNPLGIATCL